MATNKEDPKPGSERFRDEKRDGGPRMDGHQWEDYEQPREIENAELAGADAALDVVASPEQTGMGKFHGSPTVRDASRLAPHSGHGTTGEGRKRSKPISKGKPGEATQADSTDSADARPGRHGARGTGEF